MIFALTAILRAGAAFTVTAHAATLKENSWTWSEDSTIDKNLRINHLVTVNADITLNIPKGLTLTVESGIDAHDRTMTVEGEGRLDIISTKDFGFFGNLVVNGADVTVSVKELGYGVHGDLTVSGGSASVTGGRGNDGHDGGDGASGGIGVIGNLTVSGDGSATVTGGSGGDGGRGGNGGNGVYGDLTVSGGGSATVTGGRGGAGSRGYGGYGVYGDLTVSGGSATVTGGERSLGQSYKDLAVSGTITALTVAVTVEGSYDNVRWSVIPSGTVSDNSYVKASTVHDFTYTAAGNTITATCSNDDCSLTDKKLTMTIKAPTLTTYGQTGAGISAEATVVDNDNIRGDAEIKYYRAGEDGTAAGETDPAPSSAGKYRAEITLGEGGNKATAFVVYTIDPKPVTAAVTAVGRDYEEGNTSVLLTAGTVSDVLKGDEVTADISDAAGTMEDDAAGDNKTVTVSGVKLAGKDAGNYTLKEQPSGVKVSISKADAVLSAVPEKKDLTYSGSGQELVSGGVTDGGIMVYALGDDAASAPSADPDNTPEDQKKWRASIPSKTDAGTYYVWYRVAGDGDHYDSDPACITAEIKKAEATVTAKEQTIKEGTGIGTGTDKAELSGQVSGHSLSAVTLAVEDGKIVPSGAVIRDAGNKDVTGNYNISYQPGALTVIPRTSYLVTFRVINGAWDDGEGDAATADRTVTLEGHEGDKLKLEKTQIPSAGSRPKDSTFMAGSWDVEPDEKTVIEQDTVYTYIYAKKEPAAVTKAPSANNLTYNEQAQDLVTAGEATGGQLRYAPGKDLNTPPSADEYSAEVPVGTDAGTYYVWYKVFGDDTHLDSPEACFAVTIGPGNSSGSPTGHEDGLTYTGEAQELVLAGTVQGGTMLYTLGEDASTPPEDSLFTREIPKGTDAGDYYVWYRVAGDANHNDVPPACLTAVIKKASITPAVSITGWTYGEAANDPQVDAADNPGNGTVRYEYSMEESTGYTDQVPAEAGPYYVRALVAETKNYREAVSKPLGFAIARASITITADNKSGTYGEDVQALTYTAGGAYVEGDDLGVSVKCSVKKGSDVGTYPITVSWNENKNYDAQLVDGTYTVRKAAIDTASAGNSGKPAARSGLTYNGKNQKLLSAPGKLPEGCAKIQYRMSGETSWSNSIPAAAKAGNYSMEYRYAGDKNHKNSAAFQIKASIARAKITITAQDKTGPRETAIQKLTWKVTGAYVSGDNLGIKASTTAKKTSKPGKYKISVSWNKNPNYTATLKNGTYTITDRVTGPEKARTGILLNSGFRAWWEGSGLMVSWGKAENAGRYDILAAYCGKDAPKLVRTVSAKSEPVIKITSLDGKKIDRTKNIKVRVIAYRKVDGQYTRMGATLIAHVTGGQGRISGFTNARRVTVQKDSYTLKTGKTAVVRATTIPEVQGKKLLGENHAARYRYASDNKAVATVDENGKITAVGKGTCRIYVYAQNGTSQKVSVTVK